MPAGGHVFFESKLHGTHRCCFHCFTIRWDCSASQRDMDLRSQYVRGQRSTIASHHHHAGSHLPVFSFAAFTTVPAFIIVVSVGSKMFIAVVEEQLILRHGRFNTLADFSLPISNEESFRKNRKSISEQHMASISFLSSIPPSCMYKRGDRSRLSSEADASLSLIFLFYLSCKS